MEIKPPSIPPVSKEQLAQNDADQKILATRYAPSSRDMARAKAVIKESEGVELSPKQIERYSDALAQMGRYKEAFDVSGNEKFKAILTAINNPLCACPDTEEYRAKGNGVEKVVHSRLYERSKVMVDGRCVPLIACNKCGNLTCVGS